MRISITQKLFVAILTAAGLSVASLVVVMQWNLSRGFLRFVNTTETSSVIRLAKSLEQVYGEQHDWLLLKQDPTRWQHLVRMSLPEPPLPPGHKIESEPPPRPVPPPVIRHFIHRLFLLDSGKRPVIAEAAVPASNEATALRHDGKIVGYLGLLPRTSISDDHQKRFLKEQEKAFAVVAGIVVLLAACLSLLLARRLVRPIAELARATDRLAAGDFTIRVPRGSGDELGRLAQDFNALAEVLAKNEQTRKQWVADISHELRTPLAVLRGEIEALQDGIRQPSPATVRSLHVEVLRLGRLVDDLYQLSLSDPGGLSYKKRELDITRLLGDATDSYRHEFSSKGFSVSETIPDQEITVLGDPERLHQLLGNILDNAVKYTNPGGSIEITAGTRSGTVAIDIMDSAPGVLSEEMEKLFDRLYRVEGSRNRSTGGAGLGLAICRNIAEAHGGTIAARPSPLGGIWIHLELPVGGDTR